MAPGFHFQKEFKIIEVLPTFGHLISQIILDSITNILVTHYKVRVVENHL